MKKSASYLASLLKKMLMSDIKPAILAALPATQYEVIERTGLSGATVSRRLARLRSEGIVRIGSWLKPPKTGGRATAVYQSGAGADKPCPYKPKPQHVLDERSRAKRRRNGDWEDALAKQRAKYWANKVPRRDPLTEAFFGKA